MDIEELRDDVAADAPGDAPHPFYVMEPFPATDTLDTINSTNGEPVG